MTRRHDPREERQRAGPCSRRARRLIPGGVNSPVRAFRRSAASRTSWRAPRAAACGTRTATSTSTTSAPGGRCSSATPTRRSSRRSRSRPRAASSFGAPTRGEVEIAELVTRMVPSVEMVRMVNSGTEATMSAVRLARGATGRPADRQVRGVLPRARRLVPDQGRLGRRHLRPPGQPGRHGGDRARHADRAVQRPRRPCGACSGRTRARSRPSSSSRSSATWASCKPLPGFLEGLRAICARGGGDPDLRRGDDRLPPRARRRAGALRDPARPHDAGQDPRRRPAGRRLRRAARPDGADRPGRPRLPGGHALGQPARRRGGARDAPHHRSGPGALPEARGEGGGARGRHQGRPREARLPAASWPGAARCGRSSSRRTKSTTGPGPRRPTPRGSGAASGRCWGAACLLAPSQFEANFISDAHADADIEATVKASAGALRWRRTDRAGSR